MDSSILLAYASLATSKTLLQRLLACLNFTLDSEDLSLWYKRKRKVISMNYGSSTSSWKRWRGVGLDLILSMRNIYINSNLNRLTKFISRSRSTEFKDVLWNISEMITKFVLISMRIVISNVMKQGIVLLIWWKVNGDWGNNMIRISQWRENHCRTNTSVRKQKKSKRARLRESQSCRKSK